MQRTTKGLTLVVAIVVILLNLLLLVKENYIFSFLRPFGPVRTSKLLSVRKRPNSLRVQHTFKRRSKHIFIFRENKMNCSHKYHKVKAHPETGIFLYKSVRWKKIEESDYLKKTPGIVIEPDIFLIVPCLDIAIYVYLCYRKVSSEKKSYLT